LVNGGITIKKLPKDVMYSKRKKDMHAIYGNNCVDKGVCGECIYATMCPGCKDDGCFCTFFKYCECCGYGTGMSRRDSNEDWGKFKMNW